MAEDHTALLERLADAINGGVIPEDLLTPDFAIVNADTAVTDKVYEGHEGAQQWRDDSFDVFKDDARFEYRVEAAAPELVVTRLRITGTFAASGMPVDLRWMGVFRFRDGRFAHVTGFTSREEAFRAAGLEPG